MRKNTRQIDRLNKSLEFDENNDGDEDDKEIDMAIGRKELEFSGAVKAMTRKQNYVTSWMDCPYGGVKTRPRR